MTLKKKILRQFKGIYIFLLCLVLMSGFSVLQVLAEDINLELTYGYQDTAKAGRFLPLTIAVENTTENTFSGTIHIYMAESEDSIYEYQYPLIVEAQSDKVLDVTVSLSSGINQLLATAVSKQGTLMGSKRIGLDVASSDAELIVGILSDTPDALSYLGGVGINEGILRTRIVNLDAANLPKENVELDQLDVLLVSNFDMARLTAAEAAVIRAWVENGGVLMLGTGSRGSAALQPYFSEILAQEPMPAEMQIDMGEEYRRETADGGMLTLTAAPVQLTGGRDILLSGDAAVLSAVNLGAGLVAVSAYDFCDIAAFCTDQISYIDKLFCSVLGQSRLETLSVSASEKSLNEYWDIQELMRISDVTKLPNGTLYMIALGAYVVLIGPGLYFFLRERGLGRLYKLSALACAGFCVLLIWVMGLNTRFNGPFLTYARIKNISAENIEESDFINIRSPYNRPYELGIRTEYYVYPILKGTGFSGDITAVSSNTDLPHTTIDMGVDRSVIRMEHVNSFTPKYFQLTNNMPNVDGSFDADLNLFDGQLSGTISNQSIYSLSDAVLLMYGKMVKLGRLEAGATLDVSNAEVIHVPVGGDSMIAAGSTSGSRRSLMQYYLKNSVHVYFSDVRLIGFLREERPDFTDDTEVESFGTTMIVSTLPLRQEESGMSSYSALSRDPRVISGDYNLTENTISGTVPAVIEYNLGEDAVVVQLQLERLTLESGYSAPAQLVPFTGLISFYNQGTGVFEMMDMSSGGSFSADELAPYLSASNTIQIKYTPSYEDGLARAQYLPMLQVTVQTEVQQDAED